MVSKLFISEILAARAIAVIKLKEEETMKLEQQVCNLEISKRLKELGVKQESLFWWSKWNGTKQISREYSLWMIGQQTTDEANDSTYFCNDENDISAFTVAELGEMLPLKTFTDEPVSWSTFKQGEGEWICSAVYRFERNHKEWITASTEADARGKMLIYLLENNLITL